MKTTAAQTTPPTARSEQSDNSRANFLVLLFDMSWKLAIVVLVPIIGGVQLDKKLGNDHVFLFIGLALAVFGSIAVMWMTMQTANKLPVPKLSDAERAKIKRQYEEDDKDA
jgi:hypothetical protein